MCRIINFGVTNLIKTIFLYLSLSSDLLVGGVVVEVHVAGGVYLLLCTQLGWCLDRVLLVDV